MAFQARWAEKITSTSSWGRSSGRLCQLSMRNTFRLAKPLLLNRLPRKPNPRRATRLKSFSREFPLALVCSDYF